MFIKIKPNENHAFKMHKNKKKADIFTSTDFTQQKNDELFHRFHPIAHELNLKINTSLSLITPVLDCIGNSNS